MKNIIITYGGNSCEHDISIITALSAYNAVTNEHDNYILVYMKDGHFYIGKKLNDINSYIDFHTKNLKEVSFCNGFMYYKKLSKKPLKIDCVLMCNHGGVGENGSLSGFFEVNNIPYTASSVMPSALCLDKVFTKLLLEKFKIPVVNYRIYHSNDNLERVEELGYPIIIKPANLGSSVGIAYANNIEELARGVEFSLQFDEKLLIESALTNFEEYNCAALQSEGEILVSEIERPVFNKEYLNFYDKYISSKDIKREINPDIDKKIRDKIIKTTQDIYRLFELSGIVRIDYLYSNSRLYVNEINTIPGSLAFYLFKAKNYEFKQIIKLSIEDAISKFRRKQLLVKDFSSKVLENYSCNKLKTGVKK